MADPVAIAYRVKTGTDLLNQFFGQDDEKQVTAERKRWMFKRLNQMVNQLRQGQSLGGGINIPKLLAYRKQAMAQDLGRLGRNAGKRLGLGSGIAWQNIGGNQGAQLSKILGDLGTQQAGIDAQHLSQLISEMGRLSA